MIFKIYRVQNSDCFDESTGECIPVLTYEKPFKKADVVSTGGDDGTLEELVQLCDQHAESLNAHEFCGTHRLLGAVLFNQVGRKKATKILLDIARRGGLHRMSGVCCSTDSFRELKVGEYGRDWNGQYK